MVRVKGHLDVACPPPGFLYRISKDPDMLAFPAQEYAIKARFGDPKGRTSVIYAADPVTSYVETLQTFRADQRALAALAAQSEAEASDTTSVHSIVPDSWFLSRWIGSFRLHADNKFLDLRSIGTRESLRVGLATELVNLGLDDFDQGDVLTRRRDVTHLVAECAIEQGLQGIAYQSRFDARWDCWAIFASASVAEVRESEPVSKKSEPLNLAMSYLNVGLETPDDEWESEWLSYDDEATIIVEQRKASGERLPGA